MSNGGYSDKIQVLEETAYGDGGAAGEKVFGVTREVTWQVDTSSNVSYGLESAGPQGTAITDGVFAVTGTHRWELTDGKELKCILGTQGGTATAFTLAVAGALPSYSIKAVDDSANSTFVIIKGVKYTEVSLALNRDETITVEASFVAKTVENTTTFSPTVTAVEPLTYLDGYWDIAGTPLGEVESVSLTLSRNVIARRFIEQTSAGSRRLISKAIEGVLNITFEGSVIAQRKILNELFGSTTLQDVRTNKAMSLKIARGTSALTLALTGARFVSGGRTLDKEAEVALMDFGGIALDISGTGTAPSV